MIATKLHVGLLGNGGIEVPAAIFSNELWKGNRVAIFLAENVGLAVLGSEVENIY